MRLGLRHPSIVGARRRRHPRPTFFRAARRLGDAAASLGAPRGPVSRWEARRTGGGARVRSRDPRGSAPRRARCDGPRPRGALSRLIVGRFGARGLALAMRDSLHIFPLTRKITSSDVEREDSRETVSRPNASASTHGGPRRGRSQRTPHGPRWAARRIKTRRRPAEGPQRRLLRRRRKRSPRRHRHRRTLRSRRPRPHPRRPRRRRRWPRPRLRLRRLPRRPQQSRPTGSRPSPPAPRLRRSLPRRPKPMPRPRWSLPRRPKPMPRLRLRPKPMQRLRLRPKPMPRLRLRPKPMQRLGLRPKPMPRLGLRPRPPPTRKPPPKTKRRRRR